MENAARALEMAFAVFVFILGLSLSMMLVSKAKATSDQLFYMADKTTYMQNVDEADLENDRKVGAETIIPSIYRVYQENYGVTIIDETSGTKKVIARYDTNTENMIASYSNQTAEQKSNYNNYLNSVLKLANDTDSIKEIFNSHIKPTFSTDRVTITEAFWLTSTYNRERLQADLEGTKVTINSFEYDGKRFGTTVKKGLLEYLEDISKSTTKEIRESFVEVKYNGTYLTVSGEKINNQYYIFQDEDFEIKSGDTKLEVIYTIKNIY